MLSASDCSKTIANLQAKFKVFLRIEVLQRNYPDQKGERTQTITST